MKKLKLKKSDIGRWVTVKWDDVGRRDSLLIEIVDCDKRKYAKVYDPCGDIHTVELDQIIDKRDFVKVG